MIQALLGPTNTGKTHRAVERMLAHDTGMIGLPLRLLAREVYDRIAARLGERQVALVTGEEKRIPARPRYWVCTVEAMPLDREVDFIAVDEIQLVGHPQRGFVFTDRLLRARGRLETWFLGAETMIPLMRALVPTARIQRHPRLSRLDYRGKSSLSALPPRTAVVAFTQPQVYELADALRRRRGGAAVVLGALSPRTRNRQVALYQSGEVDYLVATDAIGMGLNLEVDHVALAGLSKFDGRETRALETAEIAQIAGRAGRYVNDGTFGVLAPLAELPPAVVRALEQHRFEPQRRAWWRNANLDLSSVDTLLASLTARPHHPALTPVPAADDVEVLSILYRRQPIRDRARRAERVALLWEICQIPDYRKVLPEAHAELVGELFVELSGPRSRLGDAWLAARIDPIDRVDGDLDALMGRLAAIRTWTYVSMRSDWVDHPGAWQARTRDIEDRLSDALHERLVQRFVDSSARGPAPRARRRTRARAPSENEEAARSDSPFSKLLEMKLRLASPASAAHEPSDWIDEALEAAFEALSLGADGTIHFARRPVGALRRGASLLQPAVEIAPETEAPRAGQLQLRRKLQAWTRDFVSDLLAPLTALNDERASGALRGLVYQLEQGLGTAPFREAKSQVRALSAEDRRRLDLAGIVVGRRFVYSRALLRPRRIAHRVALCNAYLDGRARLPVPQPGARSFEVGAGIDRGLLPAIGYPVVGDRAVRADTVERLVELSSAGARAGRARAAAGLLGCSSRQALRVLGAVHPRRAPRRARSRRRRPAREER